MSTISIIWDLSSAGRASALQAEGHRFEPCTPHLCRRGGTGRRAGLKILLWWHSTGSIPVAGICILTIILESVIISDAVIKYVCVAQLDRALGYGPRCRGFESSRARMGIPWKHWVFKGFSFTFSFKTHKKHTNCMGKLNIRRGVWQLNEKKLKKIYTEVQMKRISIV